jgi:anti-sigma factor RsiW
MMQPYLDRVLSEEQRREAEAHLEACPGCDKRYHFEVTLRQFVRVATYEPISPELKQKLSGLRAAD